MKIRLAQSAGFCFGVRRALVIARQTAAAEVPVYMLGDIVHNENVVKELKQSGIRNITRLADGRNKSLLIRAHGASQKDIEAARRLGYTIVDATCPMVKEIHTIARSLERSGCRVIIIGDKAHDEVKGIVGQLRKKALIIDAHKPLPLTQFKGIRRAGVVAQSTQNLNRVLAIVEELKRAIPDLKFCNTICRPTRAKQEEIRIMPLQNDAMIIIGSKKSANTKRLFEISKSLNTRSYWINSAREIRKAWFRGVQSVGITAGASTPDSTMQDVVSFLKDL